MYPHNPANLIDITQFSKLEGVVDLIYNPRRTILLLQAEMMEIPHCDGLPFLVAQGVEAANQFPKVKALAQRKSSKSCEICAVKRKTLSSSACLA